MIYIVQYILIFILKILRTGICVQGSYIIIIFVEGKLLLDYFKAPSDFIELEILNPNISVIILKRTYRRMAEILIELFKYKFSYIKIITRDKLENQYINKRAVILNMNQLIIFRNYFFKKFFECTFLIVINYFMVLIEDYMRYFRI